MSDFERDEHENSKSVNVGGRMSVIDILDKDEHAFVDKEMMASSRPANMVLKRLPSSGELPEFVDLDDFQAAFCRKSNGEPEAEVLVADDSVILGSIIIPFADWFELKMRVE